MPVGMGMNLARVLFEILVTFRTILHLEFFSGVEI